MRPKFSLAVDLIVPASIRSATRSRISCWRIMSGVENSARCLCFMLDETVNDRWRFYKDGAEIEVTVRGDRVADDSEIVRRWALDGLGLCYRSRIDVQADLASGALRIVGADWEGNNQPLYMVLANRRQVSPAVRVLRAFLVERMNAFVAA